jgi:orotate phosphoribosyltransferase
MAPCWRGISVCRPACTAPDTFSLRSSCSIPGTRRPWDAPWPTDSARSVFGPTVVLSPALGGLIIGQEVGRALDVRAIFSERLDGVMMLRRGFSLAPDDRVVVIEDVVTTGRSTRETVEVLKGTGATLVGAGSLIDRSGGKSDLGVPLQSLAALVLPTYQPEACPLCAAGHPVVKPGSRGN